MNDVQVTEAQLFEMIGRLLMETRSRTAQVLELEQRLRVLVTEAQEDNAGVRHIG